MNKLDTLICTIERRLNGLESSLPYADGQQYYRDKDKIKELKQDLSYWSEVRRKVLAYDSEGTTLVSEVDAANDLSSLVKEQAV